MKKRFPALFLSASMVFSLPVPPAGAAETEDGYEGILEEYADTSAGFFYWLYTTERDSDACNAYLLLTTGACSEVD